LFAFEAVEEGDGNFTKVWSSKETKFTVEGCSPAEEFFADATTAGKRTAKGPKAACLTLE
jgi:hypothetical protein